MLLVSLGRLLFSGSVGTEGGLGKLGVEVGKLRGIGNLPREGIDVTGGE